jgi:hypothetical protein
MSPLGRRRAARTALGLALTVLATASCGVSGTGAPSGRPIASDAQPSAAMETPRGTLPDAALPTLLPESVLNRVPTRVRIRALGIDLPVVAPPTGPDHFPYCNVAEFLPTLSRPGRPGATYVYAHARAGMFLPLLERSRTNDGRSLLGLEVEVFTSDRRRFTYEVTEVIRHVTSLESAYRATAEQLILQTSEGPPNTAGKTLVLAAPRDEADAPAEEALPPADPVPCE